MPTVNAYPNTKSILDVMLLLVGVLAYDKPLLRAVLWQLESRMAEQVERHHLSIARQVYSLGYRQENNRKVAGIKLIRDALSIGLKEAKELWELAEALGGHDKIL